MTKRTRTREDRLGLEAPRKRGRPVEPHRTEKVKAETEHLRLRIAKMRGELVPADDVEREWANVCADIRQRMLAVPSRCAARGLSRAVVAAVDEEIRAALTALASQNGLPDDRDRSKR